MNTDFNNNEIAVLTQQAIIEKIKDEIYQYHYIEKDTVECIRLKCIKLGIAEKEVYPLFFNYKYIITDKHYLISRKTPLVKEIDNEEVEVIHQFRVCKQNKSYQLYLPCAKKDLLKTKGYKVNPKYKIADRYLTKKEIDEMDWMQKHNAFAGYYVDIPANNLIYAAINKELPENKGKTNEHLKKGITFKTTKGKEHSFTSQKDCFEKYFKKKKLCSEKTFKRAIKDSDGKTFQIKAEIYYIIQN